MGVVRLERSGWRDQEISARHRLWGFDCPAVDLDFLVVEYNLGLPVALIEYKHFLANDIDVRHPTYRALIALADAASLPFFAVVYWPTCWAFKVVHTNEFGRPFITIGAPMSEREFVTVLYKMRATIIKEHALRQLNNELPGDEFPGPRVI